MLLGRYEVIRKIGSGGFGEVLLARSIGAEGFERIVALKRLKGDLARKRGSLTGIINEARIGGLLNHPNIVQVLEFIQIGPDYLLVMEYVDGLALQEILETERGSERLITPWLALDVVIQTCEGLHYAHAARSVTGVPLRLIHRDIKPSNIMITRTGTVKIMDFGVARSAANMGHSSTGSIKGTLRYLSPEQAEGSKEIGHEADLFSLGLVLCEMITGHPVYEADQEHLVLLRALQAQTSESIKKAEALVPGIGPVLRKCLAPEPDARFRTADALAESLLALRKNFPVGSGLQAMVERTLEAMDRVTNENNTGETTFSLELRRKGMDRAPVNVRLEALLGSPEGGQQARTSEPLGPLGLASGDVEVEKSDEEPWEWEWRVTAYPDSKSELDDWDEDDFDYSGPEVGKQGTPAGHLVGEDSPRGDSARDSAQLASDQDLTVDDVATPPQNPSKARRHDIAAREDGPAQARALMRLKRAMEKPFIRAAVGIVVVLGLLGAGFALGTIYERGLMSSRPANSSARGE